MHESEIATIKQWIAELSLEHRDLDEVIERLSQERWINNLQIQRLKKRKLVLKDQIAKLQSKLIPDLDA